MRRRLILAVATTVVVVVANAAPAHADGHGAPDVSRDATSEMVGGTVRTEVSEVVVVQPGPSAPATGGGGGGGASGGSSVGGGGGGSGSSDARDDAGFEPDPGLPVGEPVLACFDDAAFDAGVVAATDMAECLPDPPDDDGDGPGLVDPLVLALQAFSEMDLPAPVPASSPPLDDGTYAQLATFFYLENWESMSNSASAGAVTATATAEPLSQTWTINDTFDGTSTSVTCEGPGAPFDPSRTYQAQLPPECGWLPKHSSAGQTNTGGARSEPCFPTTVSLSWGVTWTSNAGAGGDLGVATTSTEVCLVVAELQAVVTQHGR
jgi:hypothetical protein